MCHILTELFGTKSKGYMSYKFTHLLVQVLVEHLRQKEKKDIQCTHSLKH